MRSSNKSRSRNKNTRTRSVGNVVNRVFDSSGPEGRVRGTPQQIVEKYQTLAHDAQLSNDRVAAENFKQHAEHYLRMLNTGQRELAERQAAEAQARQQRNDQQPRDNNNNNNNQSNNNQSNNNNKTNNSADTPQPDRAPQPPFENTEQPRIDDTLSSSEQPIDPTDGPDLVETPEGGNSKAAAPKAAKPAKPRTRTRSAAPKTPKPDDTASQSDASSSEESAVK